MRRPIKPVALPQSDPAGLDKLLLAAGKGVTQFLEGLIAAKTGVVTNLWDGKDGLGAVMAEQLESAGVPNKRLPDLLTPRAVLDAAGLKPKRKAARRAR